MKWNLVGVRFEGSDLLLTVVSFVVSVAPPREFQVRCEQLCAAGLCLLSLPTSYLLRVTFAVHI